LVVFVDTSALYALLDRLEQRHSLARATWGELMDSNAVVRTTSYVLLETAAIVQNRLGLRAVRILHDEITHVLTVDWISEESHTQGVEAMLFAARRGLSVVDCVSFHSMRRHHITTAFAFDAHFGEQGFTVIPEAISSPA